MVARICLVNHTIWRYAHNASQDVDFLIDRCATEPSSDSNLEYLLQLLGIPIEIIIGGCKVITMDYNCYSALGVIKSLEGSMQRTHPPCQSC